MQEMQGKQENKVLRKVKMKSEVSPLQAMKSHVDVDARVHIYTATAQGRGRVASPTFGRLYPRGKPPVFIL